MNLFGIHVYIYVIEEDILRQSGFPRFREKRDSKYLLISFSVAVGVAVIVDISMIF